MIDRTVMNNLFSVFMALCLIVRKLFNTKRPETEFTLSNLVIFSEKFMQSIKKHRVLY
jgi:hypothetical protein